MSARPQLKSPARKIFVKNLQSQTTCSLVWIQGHITQVNRAENSLFVNDGTAGVEVTALSRLGGDTAWIHPGKYCMLLGTVQRSSYMYIEAVKLIDLTGTPILERMWEVEVKDLERLCQQK